MTRCARPRGAPTWRSRGRSRDSAEVAEVVQALEQQYDAFTADRESLLASDEEPMPTAEELGAQFEQFLAEQQGRENPD